MGRRKAKFVLPRLNDCGGDLSKPWYVEYSYRDHRTDKLERFREYKGFKLLTTSKERHAHAEKIIEDLSNRILNGWSPLDSNIIVCNNHIAYNIQSRVYGNREETDKNLFYYINAFLEEKKPSLRYKTYQDYTSKLRIFHQWLYAQGKKDIYAQDVSNEMLVLFSYHLINERKLEKRTVKDFNQRISQLYNWMIKREFLVKNPAYDLPQGRQHTDHSAQPMTQKEASRLLAYIKEQDEQLYLFCAMIFYCAIRPGTELRLLKVKDINPFANTITIRIENAKTGVGVVNMPPQLADIIDNMSITACNREYFVFGKGGSPGPESWGKNYFRMQFNRFRDELGYPKEYKLYSWKCTGAILFALSGAPLSAVRDHLRHRSTAYTDIYVSKKIGKENDYVKNKFPEL